MPSRDFQQLRKLLLAIFLLARALSFDTKLESFLLVTRAEINCDNEALLMEPSHFHFKNIALQFNFLAASGRVYAAFSVFATKKL